MRQNDVDDFKGYAIFYLFLKLYSDGLLGIVCKFLFFGTLALIFLGIYVLNNTTENRQLQRQENIKQHIEMMNKRNQKFEFLKQYEFNPYNTNSSDIKRFYNN